MSKLHTSRCLLLLCISVLILYSIGGVAFGQPELRTESDCSCIGYQITFVCRAVGDGLTKWQGSAFHCLHSGNEISFLHDDRFQSGGNTKTCNDGEIIGRPLLVEGSSYISQLMVTLALKLIGSTVECVYVDLATDIEEEIGSIRLSSTIDPFPPPLDIHLASVRSGTLLFRWSAVANNCVPLYYDIDTTCGLCPNSTSSTSVSCGVNVSHTTEVCSFAIRSVVCSNITGRWSDPTNVTLKVPEPPIITTIRASYAAGGKKELTALGIEFRGSDKDVFNISRDIDGNIRNFTVIYGDSITNLTCHPVITSNLNSSLPSSCFPSVLLNNNVSVSMSAANRLGVGQKNNFSIAGTNQYVDLSTSAKRVTCRFLIEQESYNEKSCKVSYGECGKQKSWTKNQTFRDYTTTIIDLDLHPVLQDYCYVISVSINNLTVIVSGNHSSKKSDGDDAQQNRIVTALIAIAAIVLSIVVSVTATLIAFIIYWKYHRSIDVHAIFELLDRPWELLKVLHVLKVQDINIEETKIGECTPKGTRKIYMRFKQNPSDELAENVKTQIIEESSNREIEINSFVKSVQINKQETSTTDDRPTDSLPNFNGSHLKKYTYSQLLPPKSGALCSLIEGIKNLSSTSNSPYGEISIAGIKGTPKRHGNTLIQLTFVHICARDRELPRSWKKDFNNITIG